MTEACDLSAVEARRLIGTEAALAERAARELPRAHREDQPGRQRHRRHGCRCRAQAGQGDRSDGRQRGEELGLLGGLPIGIKDLQATAGLRTTWARCCSRTTCRPRTSSASPTCAAPAASSSAKTNTPEFGAGANTSNRVYGATGNPFDPAKTCGGSSGGSAVALALGQVPLATGSDLGGSLRTPAGFCGVVGFRPSPGVVPGVDRAAALSPFSVMGPMARTVADAHLLLRAQMVPDKRDPFSSGDSARIPARARRRRSRQAARWPCRPIWAARPIDKAIAEVFQLARARVRLRVPRGAGARAGFRPACTRSFEMLRCVQFVAAHRERLEKSRELLDRNVIDNTERGMKLSLPDVSRANVEQTKLYKRVLAFFHEVDVLICPAASVSPFPHAQLFVEEINGEKMPTYMRWLPSAYAPTMALACAAVLPCGVDHKGMPFGIQVIGPNGADARVLEVAYALEQVLAENKETARAVPDIAKLGK